MDIYLKPAWNLDAEVRPLRPCPGRRDEGWTACAPDCLGHFDRYDAEEGAEEANTILYWLPYVTGSQAVAEWSSRQDPCVSGLVELRLVHNPVLFETANGSPTPVWVLIVDDSGSDVRSFALALPSAESSQRAFQEEVDAVDETCDCGRLQSV